MIPRTSDAWFCVWEACGVGLWHPACHPTLCLSDAPLTGCVLCGRAVLEIDGSPATPHVPAPNFPRLTRAECPRQAVAPSWTCQRTSQEP
jgi:hypothetical protein